MTAPDSFVEQASTDWVERAVDMVGSACEASWSAGEEAVHWKAHANRRNKLQLEIRELLERQAARCAQLEEALEGLMAGCEFLSIGGDEPFWHRKCIPSNAALDAARSALSAPKEQST
jgi:hypothetical protein